MGTNQNPRQQLAAAIEANAEALAAMHSAENMLARANEMLGALRERRADFDSLNSQIATARADLLKQALESEENAHLLTEEPSGFAAAKISRDNLDLKIAGVTDSVTVLQSELVEARKAAELADFCVDEARAAVFCQEAETLAVEFHERLQEVRHMSLQLGFMSVRPVRRNPETIQHHDGPYYGGTGATSTITMPRVVTEATAEDIMGSYFRRNTPHKKDAIAAAVQQWWSALRHDPNATLGEETKTELFPPRVRSDASATDAALEQVTAE
ncbi:hypothetical protein WOC76_13365 [Methylocystis sp. IM3]|uniref:hypothetical protein n=1 Tax=unclassified Methylocystis TaxID=2625913 RepID=UPI0030F9D79F